MCDYTPDTYRRASGVRRNLYSSGAHASRSVVVDVMTVLAMFAEHLSDISDM